MTAALEDLQVKESDMSTNITGIFDTRRAAEMAVERLVQEFKVERTDIFVAPEGEQNTAGVEPAGSDRASADPTPEARNDGAHAGRITVSVDLNDEALTGRIRGAIEEFNGRADVAS